MQPYRQEQALIEFIPKIIGTQILCTSLGRAQFAYAIATTRPTAHVNCHYFDLYRHNLALASLAELPSNLTLTCAADFTTTNIDTVVMPTSFTGEAEFTRDLLQSAHELLPIDGELIVSTDNSSDTWLKHELEKMFDRIESFQSNDACIYRATKTHALKKHKNFSATFAFRDEGHLIQVLSRPGVFSHRHVDLGARQLLASAVIASDQKILDIGCGWGTVALAAALRGENVNITAIDSHTRAIQCITMNAELNHITTIHAELTANGETSTPNAYDLVLANPPYYANFRIAELFAMAGHTALRPDGEIIFVTKLPQWYEANMKRWFHNISITPSKGYHIISACK